MLPMISVDGKHGVGIAVEIPTIGVDDPNLPGPQGSLRQTVLVIENPTENMGLSGTQRSAEEVADQVLSLLHLFNVQNLGILFSRGDRVIEPTDEVPGHVAYRVTLTMRRARSLLARTGNPIITGTPTGVTIDNAAGFSGSAIYYTVDGQSYPGLDQPHSFAYSGPFQVASGATVRSVAYQAGCTGSDVVEKTIT